MHWIRKGGTNKIFFKESDGKDLKKALKRIQKKFHGLKCSAMTLDRWVVKSSQGKNFTEFGQGIWMGTLSIFQS